MMRRLLLVFSAAALLLGLSSVVLYVIATPRAPVLATVIDDPSLPSLMVRGVRLHGELFGPEDAPLVIVLHGGPGNDYRALLPLKALADRYRVFFYDQRGAGLSQRVPIADLTIDNYIIELDDIVQRFSPERPVLLVGHSWGAMLASGYLSRHPTKVAAAVLAEPGFLTSELAATFLAKTHGMQPPLSAAFFWHALRTWFESFHIDGPDAEAARDYLIETIVMGADIEGHPMAGYFCGGEVDPALLPMWRFGSAAMFASQRLADDEGHIEIDLVSGSERFTGPLLFLTGACNTLIGPDHQREQMGLFKNATLEVLPDVGHSMFAEAPQASVAAVRQLFDGVVAP